MNNNLSVNEEELKKSLYTTLPNLKTTIYTSLFGNDTLKKLGDTLTFGFLIGYFSSLENKKYSEQKITQLLDVYLSCKKTTKDLDKLLEISARQVGLEVFQQNEIDLGSNEKNKKEEVIDINQIQSEQVVELGTCPICLQEFNLLDDYNYFLDCTCLVHNECFNEFIEASITENQIPIKCPICNKVEVNQKFIYDSLNSTGKPALIEKYENFVLNYYQGKSKGIVCNCPTPGCNYMFINDTHETIFNCPMCENKYCLVCKVPYHEGRTCQQYKNDPLFDNLFYQLANKLYKQCPTCKFWIEKTVGCNHMICRCGTEFCYNCGRNYQDCHGECSGHYYGPRLPISSTWKIPNNKEKKKDKKRRKFLNQKKKQ